MRWKPGWVPVPDDAFRARHDDLLAGERWLIDGYGPWDTVEARLAACDTVIFVDHPIHVHFWWAAKRQVRSLFASRPDGPDGCPMWPVTLRLYAMMWELHRDMRPRLTRAIYRRAEGARVIHIRSPRALNRFMRNPV